MEDEDYFVPLEDQRVFGAGISRKRVAFVRSSEHELNTTATRPSSVPASTSSSIADKYLSIVLKQPSASPSDAPKQPPPEPSAPTPPVKTQSAPPSPSATRCDVCNLPLRADDLPARPHEASLAHQVCLTHSHPPSHLDRARHGLRYLSAYGWDPDSRRGLGAPGREGIREPLKGRLKVDTVGLGAGVQDPDLLEGKEKAQAKKARAAPPPAKVQKLNAKQVRKGHADARKRGEHLREMFYQSDDVLKYLGKT
ncbi:hypothetical protein BDV59DRAFT_200573 [Aspergillus ambiguus]|uniref:putative G-patch domain protein n=1 Tax=Aspergillus ambiguus TaxID=176160 RepID=UPI003CCCEF43